MTTKREELKGLIVHELEALADKASLLKDRIEKDGSTLPFVFEVGRLNKLIGQLESMPKDDSDTHGVGS